MPTINVRWLDDDLVQHLRKRASENGIGYTVELDDFLKGWCISYIADS